MEKIMESRKKILPEKIMETWKKNSTLNMEKIMESRKNNLPEKIMETWKKNSTLNMEKIMETCKNFPSFQVSMIFSMLNMEKIMEKWNSLSVGKYRVNKGIGVC